MGVKREVFKEFLTSLGVLTLAILAIASTAVEGMEFNEIMYAPSVGEEWIELYNPNNYQFNLSGWTFTDNKNTDQLTCCSFSAECSLISAPNSYVILVDQDFNSSFDYSSNLFYNQFFLCVDDYSLGNGLGNEEDTLSLGNGTYALNFSYTQNWGGYKNNKTLQRNKDQSWTESWINFGTPGQENYELSASEINSTFSEGSNDLINNPNYFQFLEITEVMVDPLGDDFALKPFGEWIELHNSGPVTLSLAGLVLYDSDDHHELYLTNSNTNSLELCPGCYTIVYRDGDSDFDLSKIQDQVKLFTGYPVAEHKLIDEVSFSQAVEGMSYSQFVEGWFKVGPTSGTENIYTSGCDWGLDLELNTSIFESDVDFQLRVSRLVGLSQKITVRGLISDVFGNEIKDYSPWTNKIVLNTASNSYSPNLKEGVYEIKFWLENMTCQDNNLGNNLAKRLIAINPAPPNKTSTLEIERSYLGNDHKVEWGDQFTVKINIYKGNETRYSVQTWVEKEGVKISSVSKISLLDGYTAYPLTIHIQLIPNCNQKISSGQATVVVEGLGLRSEQEITLQGVDQNICKDYLDYVKDTENTASSSNPNFEVIDLPTTIGQGGILTFKVQLKADRYSQNYEVWSYVYRGSKCYSCVDQEREGNTKSVSLKENEVKMVDFWLNLDSEMKEGEYKLKVKIKKNDLKTTTDLTETIYVTKVKAENLAEGTLSTLAGVSSRGEIGLENNYLPTTPIKSILETKEFPTSPGIVIYESSSVKSKKLIPYFLLAAFGLLSVVLARKN